MYYVEDNGERIPAVEQYGSGWVACPYADCDEETHDHGVSERPISHRVAHCRDHSGRGYFLLRPIVSLIGAVKWWKGSEVTKPITKPVSGPLGGIGFSPEGSNGPGLLGEVV
jgi:hypothetical protein